MPLQMRLKRKKKTKPNGSHSVKVLLRNLFLFVEIMLSLIVHAVLNYGLIWKHSHG